MINPNDYNNIDDFINALTIDDFLLLYENTITSISNIKIENFAYWEKGKNYSKGNKRLYLGENNYYQKLLYNCKNDITNSQSNPALDNTNWEIDRVYQKNKKNFISKSEIEFIMKTIKQIIPDWVKSYWSEYQSICVEILFACIMYKATSHLGRISIGIVNSQSAIDLSQSLQIPSWFEENPILLYQSQNPFGLKLLSLSMQYAPRKSVEVFHNEPNFY